MLSAFGPRAWTIVTLATTAALVATGVPTRILPNLFFARMTDVRTQDYVIWMISGVLVGLIAGTYVVAAAHKHERRTIAAGGVLTYFAVGCPVCNKLVLFALGASGAMTFFAPLQLYIGILSVVLLTATLMVRARTVAGVCAPDRARAMERHMVTDGS